jgi:hypothetical protein
LARSRLARRASASANFCRGTPTWPTSSRSCGRWPTPGSVTSRATSRAFHEQAITLLTGPEAQRAFDLSREDPRLRDRYGRNTWGQRCLLARRLVEAGVDLVTTSLDGPLCGRVGN